MRYINLARHFLINSLLIDLEYRTEFLLNILTSILTFTSGFIILYSIFSKVSSLGGWNFEQGLILFGVYLVIDAFIEIILRPNMSRLPNYIRLGTMDFILLKPVNSQFFVSFRFINFWATPNFVIGWGVVIFGMLKLGTLDAIYIIQLILMILPGIIIVYSIWCLLITTAFWWVRVDNITMLFYTFFETARFPIYAYPESIRIFLTFFIPIAFMTTFPAEATFSILSIPLIISGWCIGFIFLLASHTYWRIALSKYTSASS